jgi:hypothetical protein
VSSLLPPPPNRVPADEANDLPVREWQEAEAELPVLTEVLDVWQPLPVLDLEASADALESSQPEVYEPIPSATGEPALPSEPTPGLSNSEARGSAEPGASGLGALSLSAIPDLSDVLPVVAGLPATEAEAAPFDTQPLSQDVLLGVQRHIDAMLEFRLRQSLQPILEKMAAALVAEMREELSHTLKDVVSRAVAQEVSRHRSR